MIGTQRKRPVRRRRGLGRFGAGLIALSACAGLAPASERASEIVAGKVLQPDGTWRESAAVRLDRSGRIASVTDSDDQAPRGASAGAHVYRDAYLTPGLIELASQIGLAANASEQTSPDQMDLSAGAVFDPFDRDSIAALRAGITSAMIVPTPRAPLAGRASVVRTAPGEGGRADVVKLDSAGVFSVAPGVTNTLFGPTSRAGAMGMIRDAVGQARRGEGDAFIRAALGREAGCVVIGLTADDVFTILGPFELAGVVPTVVLREETLDLALAMGEEIAETGYRFIVGQFGLSDRPETLAGPGVLAGFGGVLGFAGGTSADDPDALRRGVALATRYGLDPAAARRALTSDAARIAGVADRLGSIERGRDADLVVWSHDPLRPDARVIAVYVEGRRVYAAETDAATIDGWDDRAGRRQQR
ncbi:MAG: hypothetical protein EA378_07960 [Phycisphaerales bacterium]|nr:MAG: hypothetical protein EA378_07960 [Phycisphaerales bacterium]